jgi:hypothetical protein
MSFCRQDSPRFLSFRFLLFSCPSAAISRVLPEALRSQRLDAGEYTFSIVISSEGKDETYLRLCLKKLELFDCEVIEYEQLELPLYVILARTPAQLKTLNME